MSIKADISRLSCNLKTNHDNKQLLVKYIVISNTLKCVADLRIYKSLNSKSGVIYCDLWLYGSQIYGSGNGKAAGYGYDKRQAAAAEAFSQSGVSFNNGDNSYLCIETMLLATAKAMNSENTYAVFN